MSDTGMPPLAQQQGVKVLMQPQEPQHRRLPEPEKVLVASDVDGQKRERGAGSLARSGKLEQSGPVRQQQLASVLPAPDPQSD